MHILPTLYSVDLVQCVNLGRLHVAKTPNSLLSLQVTLLSFYKLNHNLSAFIVQELPNPTQNN